MKQFNFGKNWQDYSNHALDQVKLKAAELSLKELVGENNIKSKSFLDIGSGSGIFSIAAENLGAKRVVGFDLSPQSIEAALKNKQRFAPESNIKFLNKSIFDQGISQLGKFDVVYSWGVLHHTGQMWRAISEAMKLVNEGGLFVIAIYNKHWTSLIWKMIKCFYNLSPKVLKKILVYLCFILFLVIKLLLTLRNPLKKDRGMSFYYDIVDWLGGYPYEYSSRAETVEYCRKHGFDIVKSIPVEERKGQKFLNTGCNEFVFKK